MINPLATPENRLASNRLKLSAEKVVAEIEALPTFSKVALQVMREGQKENTSPRDLAQTIAYDPGLSAGVLRLANSPAYGLARRVSSLTDAIMLLGNRAVRQLAAIAASEGTLNQSTGGYAMASGDLWRHSMACARTAERLCHKSGDQVEADQAFVAGLLHDVGKMVMHLHLPDALPLILALVEKGPLPFDMAEKAVLGFDHAELGGMVARRWNLPESLIHAIAWHHHPVRDGKPHRLAALVHVADAICITAGIGLGVDGLQVLFHSEVLSFLRLTQADMETAVEELVNAFAQEQQAA